MRLGAASFVVGVSACALTTDLNGFAGGESTNADGGLAPTLDAGHDGAVAETDARSTADAGRDAEHDPPCAPVVVDAPFVAAYDRSQWIAASRNVPDFPRNGTFAGEPATVLIPEAAPGPREAWSGVWLRTAVPLRSFELTLEAKLRCTTTGSCGDGFSVSWVEASNGDDVSTRGRGGAQLGVGVEQERRGFGFMIDLHFTEGFGEATAPSLQLVDLLKIDRQPWVVATRGRPNVLDAWHRIRITSDAGNIAIDVDDDAAIIGHRGTMLDRGVIGFAAGTGFDTFAVAFRHVHGLFFDCVRP